MISNLPQQLPISSAPKARFIVSWWEREVHIWVLRKPATELLNSAGDNFDINQNKKLLKTIVVKGDLNIASATINDQGTLLVVSTATDVKAFRLEHNDPVKPSDVKLTTLDLPEKLTVLGATQILLSPDGHWLCVIQEGTQVLMAHIDAAEGSFTPYVSKLPRLRRQIPRYIQNGGMGNYERNITQAAFAPDSKMLAVADLAGYTDTWVLRGNGEKQLNGDDKDASDDASSESESDDDSSEEEGDATRNMEKRWIRNPSAKLLPKLPSAPVVLSFSDDVPTTSTGNEDREDRVKDYNLVAVTSSWNILAFHPLQGSLTSWTRRHPRKALPAPVLDLMDLAKGAFWQGSRFWVYGVSFLLMLDMAQDLVKQPSENEAATGLEVQHGTKRKRIGPNSGAGSLITQSNLVPHRVGKYVGDKWEVVDTSVTSPQDDDSNSDDEMPDAQDGELTQLRNVYGGKAKISDDGETNAQRKSWWITYKYRPVLGIVPLNEVDQPLEVALVERPTWDVEMPERYYVGEEWER